MEDKSFGNLGGGLQARVGPDRWELVQRSPASIVGEAWSSGQFNEFISRLGAEPTVVARTLGLDKVHSPQSLLADGDRPTDERVPGYRSTVLEGLVILEVSQ